MLRYQNTVIRLSGSLVGTGIIPAFKANVSQSATISPRRVITTGSSPIDSWGLGGVQEYQLSADFPVILGTNWTNNNGLAYLVNYTGDNYFTVAVGSTTFNRCYLENLSVNIIPNAPVIGSATIRMFRDLSFDMPATGTPYTITNFEDKICYGHNVVTGDLGSSSDGNISAIAYSIMCQRSYSVKIWGAANSGDTRVTGFLDAVDKKMTIQNRSVNNIVHLTGISGGFYANISGADGQTIQIGVSGDSVVQSIEDAYEAGKNGASTTTLIQGIY